jgi:hypothetical protein
VFFHHFGMTLFKFISGIFQEYQTHHGIAVLLVAATVPRRAFWQFHKIDSSD